MLSFIKFLNYLNENPDNLADSQKDSLHTLLFCNTHDRFITPQLISKELYIRKSFAKGIFISLAKDTDLNVKIKCSNCNCDNDFPSSSCKECGELLEKHIPHKADVIAIIFPNGKLEISDNPKRFLRNE